jgi:hypothetical protein
MAAHGRVVEVPDADRRELERRVRAKGAPARGSNAPGSCCSPPRACRACRSPRRSALFVSVRLRDDVALGFQHLSHTLEPLLADQLGLILGDGGSLDSTSAMSTPSRQSSTTIDLSMSHSR